MKSNSAAAATKGPTTRRVWALTRLVIGVAVLAALFHFGNLDLSALVPLGRAPWTIAAAAALILLTLPLANLRWSIVLRALGIALPFTSLLRITCISTLVGQVLLGPTSGDAVRGIYAWRMVRVGGGRIAVSILVDRAIGMLGLLILTAGMVRLRWERIQTVPELTVLALSLLACLLAAVIAGTVLLAAPSLLPASSERLRKYPRISRFVAKVHDILIAFRRKPAVLIITLCLSIVIQGCTLLAFLAIATSLHIGSVTTLDVAVAAPLAMLANILPFTPGGLGVGEAAFDQLCRWLSSTATAAPYASIFFAFRAVSLVTLVPGLLAFVTHRNEIAPERSLPSAISETVYAPPDRH
jgi:glycosyltransferase 2 family protein